jgi:hypothetical protein
MKNTEDKHDHPTQPLRPPDTDLEDTVPPTPVPRDLRTAGSETETQLEPPESVRYESVDEELLKQDEITTPPPLPTPSSAMPGETYVEPRRQRSPLVLRVAVGVALALGLLSLALNGLLIYSLLDVRRQAVDKLDTVIASFDNMEGKGFHYEYHFEEEIPFSGDIPFKQDMIFPFEGDFPINTTVEVPINAGMLGTFVVEVPIDTSFYIETEVPVHVDQTVHVSTSIPVDMTIPIDIKPDDPAIQNLLSQVKDWLEELREFANFSPFR